MAHLTNFSFEFFFYDIFTEDASLLLLYHGAKESKMTKNSNQGGPALRRHVFLRAGARLDVLILRLRFYDVQISCIAECRL